MSYSVVKLVPRERHYCSKPGWWARRKLRLGIGSEVRCECGVVWGWSSGYDGPMWAKTGEVDV